MRKSNLAGAADAPMACLFAAGCQRRRATDQPHWKCGSGAPHWPPKYNHPLSPSLRKYPNAAFASCNTAPLKWIV